MSEIYRIRPETPSDYPRIDSLLRQVFETEGEAKLVKDLRCLISTHITLVAADGGGPVGFVMLSPVILDGSESPSALGLGPLAVSSAKRGRGLGGALVRAGLEACEKAGYELVFVLGHPEYYGRFGFQLAAPLGLHYRDPGLDPWFLVAGLRQGALVSVAGKVRYHRLFDSV